MNDTAAATPAPANALNSLCDGLTTRAQRRGAVVIVGALVFFFAIAVCWGLGQGPVIKPFLPITATMWSLADLLTAFLLLGQFYFNGRVALAILATAYATDGLLTWPYLFWFPGVFIPHSFTLGEQSTFVYLWMTWHAVFPVLVVASMHRKWEFKCIDSREKIVLASAFTAVLPPIAGGAILGLLIAGRDVLPRLVIGGHLQEIDRLWFHPIVVILNLAACLTLLARRDRMTKLQLWLCIAMFSACLDSFLVNLGARIYTYAWDAGKLIAVFTAGIVLVTILVEIVRLYGEQLRLNVKLERDIVARNLVEAALRASEVRFRQVEEHAPIGLALIDLEGRFMRVNPALCALTGYSEREMLSTRVQALTHPDDLVENLFLMRQAIEGIVVSYEMEKRYLHKNGHEVWVLLNGSIVHGDDGRPSYLIAQIQDITARKASEKAIEQAQRLVFAAAEAKSRFLATMSHEIRTPMNGIVGMTELLSLTELNREQSECVAVVSDSGRSLLRILDDILDYSKIEAGKLELETLDFDLHSQVRSVAALLELQYRAKGVSLATVVEAGVQASLSGDPGRLRQILVNLIGNAFKFTPVGGSVRVVVSNEPGEAERSSTRFAVIDTGIGISPDVLDRLFRPFSQADDSTTRQFGGTGLGLSISKQLVDLMGGRIGVTSDLGAGSSFWFTVPFEPSARGRVVLDAPAREMGERRANVQPRPEKLLIAEDNEVNALLAIKQFKRLGFDITVVSNGQQALEACESGRFDLLFMDCHMPVLDGYDATKAIRKLAAPGERRLPIVAMTANATPGDRDACLGAGMDDYVSKPVSLPDLRSVVARWLPNPAAGSRGVATTTLG